MKAYLIAALILFLINVIRIIDWIIFFETEETKPGTAEFYSGYVERFPDFLQPLFNSNPEPATLIAIPVCFFCAIIFIYQRTAVFIGLGVMSILMANWNLFTLM